mgnify:CR=1 FL=1
MKAKPIFINGKDYPVKYGFAALRKFSDITGTTLKELDKISDNMTMTQAIALVYAGLADGHRATKQEFILDMDDVADLMDEDTDAMTNVLSVFSESMGQPNKPGQRQKKKKM